MLRNKVVIIGQVNLLRKTFMSLVLLTALSASVLALPASADPQTAIIDTGLTPGASLEVTSEYGNLTLGDSGSEVLNLQARLKDLGYYSYKVTGYYGELTEYAVKLFQKYNNISATGTAGPQTNSVL